MLTDQVDELKLKNRQSAAKVEEEVKESKDKKESSGSQVLPCFDFYNNLDSLNISDLQFKKDFKYTIIHPYW